MACGMRRRLRVEKGWTIGINMPDSGLLWLWSSLHSLRNSDAAIFKISVQSHGSYYKLPAHVPKFHEIDTEILWKSV